MILFMPRLFTFLDPQLAMWTVYKREIITLEKENEEFLKHYYKKHKDEHEAKSLLSSEEAVAAVTVPVGLANGIVMPSQESEEVELDSDEEAPQKPK